MITEEQYKEASETKEACEKIMHEYHVQQNEIANKRYKEFQEGNAPYTDEELYYSRESLCPCGHGLAYVKKCGSEQKYWDCSAILKGIADSSVQHTGQLPFAFYDVKGEQEYEGQVRTTRGVFKPKPKE
ncbi:hypothetical protein MASR1M48_17400 [Lactococcus petauri]